MVSSRPSARPKTLLAALALTLLIAGSGRSAMAAVAADFLIRTHTDTLGTTPYRLYVPPTYSASTAYPLVLFLHGVGENGSNNTAQLNNRANGAFVFVEQAANPAFMIAPQNWNGASGWGDNTLRAHILKIVQKAQADYNIDERRIYVVGLSNGGAGTWDQMNTYPWLYAAGVPICGWGSATDKIKDIPIWCFHAANDPTVGVASSDNAINGIRNLGGNPIYTRYATGGHGSWTPAFQTQEMVTWLFAQRRGVKNSTAALPYLQITTPTNSKGYATTAATLTLGGTATDMLPADGASTGITSVDWTNSAGALTGAATGTTAWSSPAIALSNGLNRIRFIATGTSYKSANGGNTTFTDVVYVHRGTAADTTPPTVNITTPNTTAVTVTADQYTMVANASDNAAIADFTWSSSMGYSGNAQSSWPIFLKPGANVITVTATDTSGNTTSKSVTITYTPLSGNQPPIVDAGLDLTAVLPSASVSLNATVSDDGLAPGGATTVTWSKVSGPGTVSFGNAAAIDTTATISAAGVYILRLTATDGDKSASDDVRVTVGLKRWLFDFGDTASLTTGNWNNITAVASGSSVTGALDSTGAATGVGLALTSAFTATNANGTTSATLYPATAQQDSFYVQATTVGNVNLTGLNAAGTYQLTFFASRLTPDDRTTEYTIGSTVVTLDPTDNTTKTAVISNVTPAAGGTIAFSVKADGGTGYGYIGVLDLIQLTDVSAPDTTAPTVTITTPTTNATHATGSATLAIGGTASDNVGVTQVTWSNDRGGSGTATGTTSWSVASVALQSGANVLTVTARDAANNTSTDTLTVTYTPAVAPTITTPPASTTVNLGQTATFSVVASGTATLTYQWRKNGTNISGATAASYTTPATVAGDDGATFSVVVTNSAGSVTSANATLTVRIPPAITTPPASVTVNAGQTATFSVTATGTATLTYQWRKNGTSISGATAASYTTPATVAGDNGATFSVVVTNAAGSVTSANATLTVRTAPAITMPPANVTVDAGQTATFSVVASGTAPLTYQWRKNGTNISGATSASYTTPATVLGDSGATFSVVVTNVVGSVTSANGVLTVVVPLPVVTISAAASSVAENGAGVTATVTRTGSTAAALTVNLDIGGSATSGSDYAALATTVTINAGQATGSITVTPIDNTVPEASESVSVAVAANAAYTVGSSNSVSISITDNDTFAILSGVTATPNPVQTAQPTQVTLATNAGAGDAVSYAWNFGDGSTGSGATIPAHSYAAAGTYTVTITATHAVSGQTATGSVAVTAQDPIPPVNVAINFQLDSAPVPAGYLKDAGAVFGDRGNGQRYGWNADNSTTTRDRNAANSPDQRYDTLAHLQKPENPNASWELEVPNGSYRVRIVSGDPSHIDSVYRINAEGVLTVSGTPSATVRWFDGSATVTVVDGRLTLSNAAGSANNKICFVEVSTATAGALSREGEESESVYEAEPFTVTSLKLKMNFKSPKKDTYAVKGLLPKLDFAAGTVVSVDVGAAIGTFTLNARGQGKIAGGVLTVKNAKTGVAFSAALKGGWRQEWDDGGLTDATVTSQAVVPVTVTVNGRVFGSSKAIKYSAKKGKSGSGK